MCVKQMNDGLNGQNGAVSVASPEGEAVCLSAVYFDLHEHEHYSGAFQRKKMWLMIEISQHSCADIFWLSISGFVLLDNKPTALYSSRENHQ